MVETSFSNVNEKYSSQSHPLNSIDPTAAM